MPKSSGLIRMAYPNMSFEVELPELAVDDALEQFSRIVSCFEKASAGAMPNDLTVSRTEVDVAWNGIVEFDGLVAGTDFRGAFELATAPDLVP